MNKIRLSKSVVGELEKAALSDAIDDGYLGKGNFVKKFEEKLCRYIGREHIVCVNSGTAALHLALMGIGIRPDDEVLVQSLTYVASFQAICAILPLADTNISIQYTNNGDVIMEKIPEAVSVI